MEPVPWLGLLVAPGHQHYLVIVCRGRELLISMVPAAILVVIWPLPLCLWLGPHETQYWLISTSRDPGQHSTDMSKAFHLTAGLGCSCLQHCALETWGWPHTGKGAAAAAAAATSCLGRSPHS